MSNLPLYRFAHSLKTWCGAWAHPGQKYVNQGLSGATTFASCMNPIALSARSWRDGTPVQAGMVVRWDGCHRRGLDTIGWTPLQESIEPLESAAQRPASLPCREIGLLARGEVPLPYGVGVPAPFIEHLGNGPVLERYPGADARNPPDASVMQAMLLLVAFRPVMRLERVGEQRAVVWKLLNRMPESAIRVIFGVSTGPPNVSMVPYPTSSQTIIRILGIPPERLAVYTAPNRVLHPGCQVQFFLSMVWSYYPLENMNIQAFTDIY